MITINLYDYKRIVRDVGIQKRIAMVAASSLIAILVCCGIWMFQKMLIWKTEGELAEVQAKVVAATPAYNAVQELKKRQGKYLKIISGIDKLRSDQARTSEFLEDIGQAVPEGVWLTSIEQLNMKEIKSKSIPFLFISYDKASRSKSKKKDTGDKFVQLKGVAIGDSKVVHLLEQLRALPYIDAVVLHKSKRAWMVEQSVQKFEIYCHFLKTKPAA
jgi:Tfp pilus assembly protein PilN